VACSGNSRGPAAIDLVEKSWPVLDAGPEPSDPCANRVNTEFGGLLTACGYPRS
jgi:hypothetical protein